MQYLKMLVEIEVFMRQISWNRDNFILKAGMHEKFLNLKQAFLNKNPINRETSLKKILQTMLAFCKKVVFYQKY